MSNEEFQKIVLNKLSNLENDMKYVKHKLDVIEGQTGDLTEFREAVKQAAKDLTKKIG